MRQILVVPPCVAHWTTYPQRWWRSVCVLIYLNLEVNMWVCRCVGMCENGTPEYMNGMEWSVHMNGVPTVRLHAFCRYCFDSWILCTSCGTLVLRHGLL